MSRDLDAATLAALDDDVVYIAFLFEAEFADGWVRAWTGIGDRNYGGNTYAGIGWIVGMSSMEETTEVKAAGFTVSLNGVPAEVVSIVLQSLAQNKAGRVHVALDTAAGANIGTFKYLEGRLDVGQIDERAETATIALQYESRLIDLERASQRRYTNEDQQQEYSGDRGLEYVAGLVDVQVNWGGAGQSTIPTASAR